MSKRPVSFETYCKRNVTHAAKKLSPEAGQQLIRAFKATHTMDIYGGELDKYLAVIACRLEDADKRIEEFKTKIAKFKESVEDL